MKRRLMWAAASAVALAACDGNGSSPIQPTPVGFELGGPASVAPGETVQFVLQQVQSDGSRRAVLGGTIWSSSNPQVLSVTPSGSGTGHRTGHVQLSVALGASLTTREIAIVPAGSAWIHGIVSDATEPSLGLRDAVVEVTDGRSTGLRDVTDETGRYDLYGVTPPGTIRFSSIRRAERTEAIDTSSHRAINVQLERTVQFREYSGSYTLTLTVAERCKTWFPPEGLRRTYTANVVQQGIRLSATLSGARFVTSGRLGTLNAFQGLVTESGIEIDWRDNEPYYGFSPGLFEVLSDLGWYVPVGLGRLIDSPDGLRGTFDGSISSGHYTCPSTDHQISLIR